MNENYLPTSTKDAIHLSVTKLMSGRMATNGLLAALLRAPSCHNSRCRLLRVWPLTTWRRSRLSPTLPVSRDREPDEQNKELCMCPCTNVANLMALSALMCHSSAARSLLRLVSQ